MRAATIERNGVVLEQWQWDALDVELPRKLRHAATGPFVYFAQEVDGEAIKIGTASEPWARLVGLQTGNPRKLEIRQLVVGGAPVETRFHRLWTRKGALIRDEWFGNGHHDSILALAKHIAQAQLDVLDAGRLVEAGLARCVDDGLRNHRAILA